MQNEVTTFKLQTFSDDRVTPLRKISTLLGDEAPAAAGDFRRRSRLDNHRRPAYGD